MLANICSKERWGNPFLRLLVAHLSVLIALGFISIDKWLKIHLSITMLNIIVVFGTISSYFPSHTHAPIKQELRKVTKWVFTFHRLPSSCDTLFPEAELLHSASVGLRLSRDEKSSFPLSPMCHPCPCHNEEAEACQVLSPPPKVRVMCEGEALLSERCDFDRKPTGIRGQWLLASCFLHISPLGPTGWPWVSVATPWSSCISCKLIRKFSSVFTWIPWETDCLRWRFEGRTSTGQGRGELWCHKGPGWSHQELCSFYSPPELSCLQARRSLVVDCLWGGSVTISPFVDWG